MMAARTAGRLGLGGGPDLARLILFSPLRLSEAVGLKEEEGDHGHERMPIEPLPGSPLEVVEAKLLLHLLMRLLADPSRLDRAGQALEWRVGGQVGEIVLPLAL